MERSILHSDLNGCYAAVEMILDPTLKVRPSLASCWRYANGLDTSQLANRDYVSPIKSIGHGITCGNDLESAAEVWKVILDISQDIGHRLRGNGLEATGAQKTIKVSTLMYKQYQAPLELATQSDMELALLAQALFHKNYRWSCSVRSVTERAINEVIIPGASGS